MLKGYEDLKNHFRNEKKKLKAEQEEKLYILPRGEVKLVKIYVAAKRK